MDQKKKKYEITLIIPTYNSEKFIENTIESAQKFLTHYEYEILVVDDGSTDSTLDKVKKAFFTDANIHLISNPHMGVSQCRNVGIDNAESKYIMFCDSDDLLKGTLQHMDLNEDIISFSQNCKVNQTFSTTDEKKKLIESLFGFNASSEHFPAIYGGSVSKLFKTGFLRERSIKFDPKLTNSEDIIFNMQAIIKAKSIRTICRGIYVYQLHSSSVTHSFDDALQLNHIYFIAEVKRILHSLPETEELVEKIKSLYTYQLVFRYWIHILNPISEFRAWKKEVNKGESSLLDENLNRSVERITVHLINKYGIRGAIIFAKIYVLIKNTLPHSSNKLKNTTL